MADNPVHRIVYRGAQRPACWSLHDEGTLNSKLTHLCRRLRPLLFRLRGCTARPRLLQFCPLLFLHVLCRRRAGRHSFAVALCRLPLPLQSTKVKYSSANTKSEKNAIRKGGRCDKVLSQRRSARPLMKVSPLRCGRAHL